MHIGYGRARKGLSACEHLEDHAAKCPDIGALVDRQTARLLGTHVGRRTKNGALMRAAGRGRYGSRDILHLDQLRKAEVQDLYRAVGRQLDVRRFQIPMDDALLVRRVQCLGDLTRNGQRLGHRQGVAGECGRPASVHSISSRTRKQRPFDSSNP